MIINLFTDAPKHNLALMKISAGHKQNGDSIYLNDPTVNSDISYASILFEQNKKLFKADVYGGPAFNQDKNTPDMLPTSFEYLKPDYSLFKINYSLGYTFRPCYNTCGFCKVPKMMHPDGNHHSIWEFHDSKFDTICILNNNTFQDPNWLDTFEEIWDANLSVRDENGYDLRLLDDSKVAALKKTRWATPIHFAWDRMCDEPLILNGLQLLNKHKMRSTANGVYVLIGYNTSEEEDLHRCQVIHNYGLTPYPMPYIKNDYTKRFKRFINLHYYRKYKTIKDAWKDYKK